MRLSFIFIDSQYIELRFKNLSQINFLYEVIEEAAIDLPAQGCEFDWYVFLLDTDGVNPVGGPISPALLKSALVTHQRSQSLSGLQVHLSIENIRWKWIKPIRIVQDNKRKK